MSFIDAAYIQRTMTAEDFARVFDRNGTGSYDSVFLDGCIAVAESVAQMTLNGGGAIQPVPLTGVIDEGVKILLARMAVYEAVRMHTSDGMGGTKSPYRQANDDAIATLTAIRNDQMRLITANHGDRSYPRADVTSVRNTDGNIGGVYNRADSGKDRTGY